MMDEHEDDIAAAELALGVLQGEDRAAAMRRVLADPDFAREVENWRTHFATMFAEVQPVEPPARLLARIEAAVSPRRIGRLVWPVIAAALAASLILVLLMRPATVAPPALTASTLVASLAGTDKGAQIPALYDIARGEIRIAGLSPAAPGRSSELWMIGSDGVPRSLGLLPSGERVVISVNETNRLAVTAGTKLAISSEPPGGSLSGQPTGPILAIGALIRM